MDLPALLPDLAEQDELGKGKGSLCQQKGVKVLCVHSDNRRRPAGLLMGAVGAQTGAQGGGA